MQTYKKAYTPREKGENVLIVQIQIDSPCKIPCGVKKKKGHIRGLP